jgi:hypothetical protein
VGRRGTFPAAAILFLAAAWTFGAAPARAQSIDLSNLTLSNQLEYSLEEGTHDEILEDWFELRYQTDPFSFGARFEAFQPSERKDVPPDSTFEAFPFRYVEFQRDDIRITAGNFYDIFGRGIAFRSYENRDIRIDNSLDGIRVAGTRDIFDFKFMTGSMLLKDASGLSQRRRGLLHAANFESRLTDRYALGPLNYLLLGTSWVRQEIPEAGRREIATVRGETGLGPVYFYGEYGDKLNRDGSAIYLGTNIDLFGAGLSLEYKRYEDFAMRINDPQVSALSVDYNNPPALTREHSYTLLSRNAYTVNVDDETGYQVEFTWSPAPMNTLLANYSRTESLDGTLRFEEFYAEWTRYQGERFYGVVAFASQINEDIRSVVPVVELEFFVDPRNSFRTELQHQHQKSTFLGEFDVDLLVAEYSRSPTWTLSLIAERDNMSDFQRELQQLPDRNVFIAGQASIHLSESNDLQVFAGARQKGKVCVGGVCRTEPEFEGVEVKLFSRF